MVQGGPVSFGLTVFLWNEETADGNRRVSTDQVIVAV
jgi:hypothetical protein